MTAKTPHKPNRLVRLLTPQMQTLSPAYFGMVMATGIVSLAVVLRI